MIHSSLGDNNFWTKTRSFTKVSGPVPRWSREGDAESSSWGFPGPAGPGHIAERPLAAAGRLGDPRAPGRRSPRRKPTESVARPGARLDFYPVQAVKTAAGSGVARLLVPQGPQDGAWGRAQAPWGYPPTHVAHRGPGAWNPTLEPWNQPARQLWSSGRGAAAARPRRGPRRASGVRAAAACALRTAGRALAPLGGPPWGCSPEVGGAGCNWTVLGADGRPGSRYSRGQ